MPTEIKHKYFFAQSPEAVWEYLTKSELMEQWLMKNDFLPVVGHDFQFRSNPVPALDFDGIIYCKVLKVIPFKTLSYSWKCGPGDGKITLDSIVLWTLHPKDNGTELFLENTGFKEIENFNIYAAMNDGWQKNIKKIADYLNTEKDGATNT